MTLLTKELEFKLRGEIVLNLDEDLQSRKELVDRLTSLFIARIYDAKTGNL